jgi:hypothetical protein
MSHLTCSPVFRNQFLVFEHVAARIESDFFASGWHQSTVIELESIVLYLVAVRLNMNFRAPRDIPRQVIRGVCAGNESGHH